MDGRARGIDVSHNNGNLDWNAISGDTIDFAIAKATEGADPTKSWYEDSEFKVNWQAMRDAGLIRGAYHFVGLPLPSTAEANWTDDLHSQIDHFFDFIGPLQTGDLPPALDFEAGDSPARWKSLIESNLDGARWIVRELISYTTTKLNGTRPLLYTGSFWWDSASLADPDPDSDNMPFSTYPLWFAQYPVFRNTAGTLIQATSFDDYAAHFDGHMPAHIPKVWGGPTDPAWSFWQFSSAGRFPGMTCNFDLDVFNGDLAALKQICL